MNVKNILAVAEAIEQHTIIDLGFNMSDIVAPGDDMSEHNCGTVACIAGWAIALEHQAKDSVEALDAYMKLGVNMHSAAEWLGLEYYGEGEVLFLARGHPGTLGSVKPAQAVRTLRHLAATGEVDWTV